MITLNPVALRRCYRAVFWGDVQGEPIVISPLYKQRIRLRDGRQYDSGEQAVRAWPVKVEAGKVWVGTQALILRAEAS